MVKIKRYGLKQNESGEWVCDQCGGSLFRPSAHVDYTDRYETHYQCAGCENVVMVSVKRSKNDMMMWGGE